MELDIACLPSTGDPPVTRAKAGRDILSVDIDPMPVPKDRSQAIAHHVAVLMHHDTGNDTFKLSAHTFANLWEDLVPEEGQANSIQGEILRAIGVLAGEERRNGCVNWDRYYKDYEQLIEFLRTWLPNESVFNVAQRGRISQDLDAVLLDGHEGIPYETIRLVFGRLIEDAVAFCQAYPIFAPMEQRPSGDG
jgi:hypothetical protein